MDVETRNKILKTFAFRRYQVRGAHGVPGNDKDDYEFAIKMLAHEIDINGEDFIVNAYGQTGE